MLYFIAGFNPTNSSYLPVASRSA